MTRSYGGDDLARRIKDAIDIVDVVGSYIELGKRGANHMALCPFHAEKTPSFNVNRPGQFFHCFGCKKSGDVFDFVMALEGVDFPEALRLLGDRVGIHVERDMFARQGKAKNDKQRLFSLLDSAGRWFERNLQHEAGVEARKYLNRRHLGPEVLAKFRIGYASDRWDALKNALLKKGFTEAELIGAGLVKRSDKGRAYDLFRNRLMLPIFDIQGRVIGFGGRVLDDSQPKYINSPETPVFRKSRSFYGLNLARRRLTERRCAVIVEGYTDVIKAHAEGVDHAVATLGTALTEEHAKLLSRMVEKVILLFDGDEAGGIAAGRGVEVLLTHDLDVTVVTLDEGIDPFDYFSSHDAGDFERLVAERGEDFFDFTLGYFSRRYDRSTVGGRTKLARTLMRLVSCHRDVIRKDLLLTKISQTLGVTEEILRTEFMEAEAKRDGGHGPAIPLREVTITSTEDDLIIGLLRQPSLVREFEEQLASIRTEDPEYRVILDALLDKAGSGSLEVRELTSHLMDRPEARMRLIELASDRRKSEPRVLVESALAVLEKRRAEREYAAVVEERKRLLEERGSAEADTLLKDIVEKLRKQKGMYRPEENQEG